jgi:ribosomal protein L11 methyltransferase
VELYLARAEENENERGASSSCPFPVASAALRGRQFHVTVANILAPVLVGLAPALAALTRPGGNIALSGILDFQAQTVLDRYAPFFEDLRVDASEGEWVLVTGRRRAAE